MAIDKKQLSETDIRTKYITPAIEAAGWNKMTQMREKYPITAGRIIARGQVCKREKPLKADYVLFINPTSRLQLLKQRTIMNSLVHISPFVYYSIHFQAFNLILQ